MTNQNLFTVGDSLLRLPEVLAMVPVGRSTWWRWVAEGIAPRGIKLGPRTTVWRTSDIRQLIERRMAEGTK